MRHLRLPALEDLSRTQRIAAALSTGILLVALGLLLMPVSVNYERLAGTGNSVRDRDGPVVEATANCAPALLAAASPGSDMCTSAGRRRVGQGIVLSALGLAGGWIAIRLLDTRPGPSSWSNAPRGNDSGGSLDPNDG